jgi:nucleoside 2-deoxyribosyltransferase
MKVYVAGKWEDKQRCKSIMNTFEANGISVTCDWTDHKYEDEGYPELYCHDDVNGVKEADFIVCVFVDDLPYRGALVEMGIALGLGKPIFILGHAQDSCIFHHHPLVKPVESVFDILREVKQ